MADFFHDQIADTDPLVSDALAAELNRQQTRIELIASENIVSQAVLDALAHPITNKTLEGYPGNRFHGGGEFVDIIEQAAIGASSSISSSRRRSIAPGNYSPATMPTYNRTRAPRRTRLFFSHVCALATPF